MQTNPDSITGECTSSCVSDERTTCFSSNIIEDNIVDDNAKEMKLEEKMDGHENQEGNVDFSSNKVGIYCLVGDLTEGTSGATPVMCKNGQKCMVTLLSFQT